MAVSARKDPANDVILVPSHRDEYLVRRFYLAERWCSAARPCFFVKRGRRRHDARPHFNKPLSRRAKAASVSSSRSTSAATIIRAAKERVSAVHLLACAVAVTLQSIPPREQPPSLVNVSRPCRCARRSCRLACSAELMPGAATMSALAVRCRAFLQPSRPLSNTAGAWPLAAGAVYARHQNFI